MGEAVDCPLCQKYIKLPFVPTEFGKKFIKVSEAMQIPVGCVGILIGLVVWLFCFGLIVVAAIMFVTFVLTKLGIMRVNN